MFLVQRRLIWVLSLLLAGEALANRVDYITPLCIEIAQHDTARDSESSNLETFESLLFTYGLKSEAEALQFFTDFGINESLLIRKAVLKSLSKNDLAPGEQKKFVVNVLNEAVSMLLDPENTENHHFSYRLHYIRHSRLLSAVENTPENAQSIQTLFVLLTGPLETEGLGLRDGDLSLQSISSDVDLFLALTPYDAQYIGLAAVHEIEFYDKRLLASIYPRASATQNLQQAFQRFLENDKPQSTELFQRRVADLLAAFPSAKNARQNLQSLKQAIEEFDRDGMKIMRLCGDWNMFLGIADIADQMYFRLKHVESIESHIMPDSELEKLIQLREKQRRSLQKVQKLLRRDDLESREKIISLTEELIDQLPIAGR